MSGHEVLHPTPSRTKPEPLTLDPFEENRLYRGLECTMHWNPTCDFWIPMIPPSTTERLLKEALEEFLVQSAALAWLL